MSPVVSVSSPLMYTFGVVMCASPLMLAPPSSVDGSVKEASRLAFCACDVVVLVAENVESC